MIYRNTTATALQLELERLYASELTIERMFHSFVDYSLTKFDIDRFAAVTRGNLARLDSIFQYFLVEPPSDLNNSVASLIEEIHTGLKANTDLSYKEILITRFLYITASYLVTAYVTAHALASDLNFDGVVEQLQQSIEGEYDLTKTFQVLLLSEATHHEYSFRKSEENAIIGQ